MGVFGLGLFVGYLLALGLKQSKPTLRAVLTVLGAALGGVPVAFLAGAGSKWIYPLGLLGGLLILRLDRRRKEPRLVGCQQGSAVAAALILPDKAAFTQRGQVRTLLEVTRYSIYNPNPFESPPNLVIGGAALGYELTEQRTDGFVLHLISYASGEITWEATGVLKRSIPADNQPNPSVERTHNGGARCLAVPTLAARRRVPLTSNVRLQGTASPRGPRKPRDTYRYNTRGQAQMNALGERQREGASVCEQYY